MTLSDSSSPMKQANVADINVARSRVMLSDRGINPDELLGKDAFGNEITAAGFHGLLGRVAASEKAGQAPIYGLARLALACALPAAVEETLFLAYNQQSAEEAGHGDKVFGNAYFALGGCEAEALLSVLGNPGMDFLHPGDDPDKNRKLLWGTAAAIGGVETVALQQTLPALVTLCESWKQPAARDLAMLIHDVVRPEESRHVLIWRYVFHELIAPNGEAAIGAYLEQTNAGRRVVAAPDLNLESFVRLLGMATPSTRQILGKERVLLG